MSRAFTTLKYKIKTAAKKLLRITPEVVFIPAKSIRSQRIDFTFNDKLLSIEADYTTPLYETIAEIVDYDCYQLQKFPHQFSPDAAIIDIGANIGIGSVIFSTMTRGKVYCCEPMPANCRFIEKTKEINKASNMVVVPKAVAGHTGTMKFQMEEGVSVSAHAASAGLEKKGTTRTIEVESISVRDLIDMTGTAPIALIKIDCEGGEYDIMAQFDKSLSERITAFTFEVHDLDESRNVRWIESKMRELGYSVQKKDEMFKRSNLHHVLAYREH